MEYTGALKTLQEKIGYHFKNEALLVEAMTHASFAYEAREKDISDNGRLEFLGDSILGIIIAEELYRKHPNAPEGELTRLRSLLVNRDSLSKAAKTLGISEYMRLGRGEEKTLGRMNSTNLAGVFEALIAAIYLDGGFEEAKKFIFKTSPEI